jgi:toxin ParE1/3/4
MPVIRRTAQAEEDLIDLWLYIAQDNPGAADRLLEEIEDKCARLVKKLKLTIFTKFTSPPSLTLPLASHLVMAHTHHH